MKTTFIVLIFSCAMAVVYGIVCPPDVCKQVTCDSSVTESSCSAKSNSVYRPQGGFCSCCPTCITLLGENDKCFVLRGVPPSAECREPLSCIDGVCSNSE